MRLITILTCSIFFSLPALVNGYPLVFPDSGTYVRQAIALSGELNRHPYYSLFIFPIHMRVSLWPIVFAQGVIASIFFYITIRVMGYKRPLLFLVYLTAILTLFTSLPWFSSEIMPDVFAGLVILSVFLLAFAWERLSLGERWFLVFGLAVMLTFHPTFPPLTILLSGFVMAVHLLRRVPRRQVLRTQALLLGPVSLAFLAMIVYSEALIHQATILPWTPPLMLARVITDGPGRAYLRESCKSGTPYLFCAYLDKLPDSVNDFLFASDSPLLKVTQSAGVERTRAEASSIVRHAILRYPLWQLKQSLINFAHQLIMFRGIEPTLCQRNGTDEQLKSCLNRFLITKVVAQYFSSEFNDYMNSRQSNDKLSLMIIYYIDVTVVLLSGATCLLLAYSWRKSGGPPDPLLSDLLAVIVMGVASNAALTGILSAPQDRYQARVIWLFPFFIVLYFGRPAASSAWTNRWTALARIPTSAFSGSGDDA